MHLWLIAHENDLLSGSHPMRKSSHSSREKPLPTMTVIKSSVEWKLFEKIADLVRLTPDKMKPRCHEWLLRALYSFTGVGESPLWFWLSGMPFLASSWWTQELLLYMPGVYSSPSNHQPPKESSISSHSSQCFSSLLSWFLGSRDYAIFWSTILPLFPMKWPSKWQAYTQYGPQSTDLGR